MVSFYDRISTHRGQAELLTDFVLWLKRNFPALYSLLKPIYRATYVPYVHKKRSQHIYQMITMEEWARHPQAEAVQLLPAEATQTDNQTGYDLAEGKAIILSRHETFMPAVTMFTVRNAVFTGHSEVILANHRAIVPRVYMEEDKISREEVMSVYKIHGHLLCDLRKHKKRLKYREALSLVNATSSNWAHFLTEVLPKAYLFNDHFKGKKINVIIDRNIPPSVQQCLDEVLPKNWKQVKLGSDETIQVKRGIFISPLCHAPFEYRNPSDVKYEDAIFCEGALGIVRERLIPAVKDQSSAAPLFLYVKRPQSSQRPMQHIEEIDALVTRFGFTIVEPNDLTFRQQVDIFSKAQIVMGQGGAGLMNVMFAPENCRIYNLCYYDKVLNYFYFGAIAQALKQHIVFIFGKIHAESDTHPLLAGLNLDVEKLEAYMRAHDMGIIPAETAASYA